MVAMNMSEAWPDVGRLILVNENIGGHATMHLNIYRALAQHPENDCVAVDVPARSFLRRVVGVYTPNLGGRGRDHGPHPEGGSPPDTALTGQVECVGEQENPR